MGLGGDAIRPCTGFPNLKRAQQVFKIGEIQARKSPCSELFNAIRPTASTAVLCSAICFRPIVSRSACVQRVG